MHTHLGVSHNDEHRFRCLLLPVLEPRWFTSYSSSYILRTIAIKSPHVMLFNLHRTQVESERDFATGPRKETGARSRKRENRAQLDDSQRRLPSLSFLISSSRLLQTVYRPIFHTLHPIPQYLFLSFRVRSWTIAPPARAGWGRFGWGEVYDLERVEIWE